VGDWAAAIVGLVMSNVVSHVRGKIAGDSGFAAKATVTWAFRLLSMMLETVKRQTGFDLTPLVPALIPLLKAGQVTRSAKKATQRWVDDFFADGN